MNNAEYSVCENPLGNYRENTGFLPSKIDVHLDQGKNTI
jgi:hypothetical protein